MSINLWIEKFRPKNLDEYVGSDAVKQRFGSFIETGEIPHLLFHGKAGTGKTTMAKILVNNIDCDDIYINASDERGIDIIRNKIKNFASTVGFSKWKVVVLDEADYLTPESQAALRNMMETFADRTRFILTCNYPEKVIPAIQSRCQTFKIEPPSMKDIAVRCVQILKDEGISFDPHDLKTIIETNYPDIRKVMGDLQSNVVGDTLELSSDLLNSNDLENKIIDTLKSSMSKKDKFTTIRQMMLDSGTNDYTNLYSLLYKRVDEYGTGNVGQIILVISDSDSKSIMAVDKEITAMACLIQILDIIG